MDIRMLKDGTRTVIIINGEPDGLDEKIYKLVKDFAENTEEDVRIQGDIKPLGLVPLPPETPQEAIPSDAEIEKMKDYEPKRGSAVSKTELTLPEYSGLTAGEALQRDEEEALVKLYEHAKHLPAGTERSEISTLCKAYMAQDLSVRAERIIGREEVVRFLTTLAPMIMAKELSGTFGFTSLSDLCALGSDDELSMALRSVVESLASRGTRTAVAEGKGIFERKNEVSASFFFFCLSV
jgi:hypothetical protein